MQEEYFHLERQVCRERLGAVLGAAVHLDDLEVGADAYNSKRLGQGLTKMKK